MAEMGHIPGTEDDATVVGVVFEFLHDLGDLIYAFARVVGVAVFVFCSKVSPLKAIDWAEVAFFTIGEA